MVQLKSLVAAFAGIAAVSASPVEQRDASGVVGVYKALEISIYTWASHVINYNGGVPDATTADVALTSIGAEVFALATTITFTPPFSVDDSNLVLNHTITTMELIVEGLDALNHKESQFTDAGSKPLILSNLKIQQGQFDSLYDQQVNKAQGAAQANTITGAKGTVNSAYQNSINIYS